MQTNGSVQSKIPCVFQSEILAEKTTKRSNQPYRVVASDVLRETAVNSEISTAHPSEKIDGTCCYVTHYRDKPWLWARHDRKPNKAADKRFRKFQNLHREWTLKGMTGTEPLFQWNCLSDFKYVPEQWIAASGVEIKDGIPQPDDNGHIPGWVPVDAASRQHCWHLSALDLNAGLALILHPKDDIASTVDTDGVTLTPDSPKSAGDTASSQSYLLEITIRTLAELLGCTLELIGTMVNGNPYSLGSKQHPVHMFVPHGSISFITEPPIDYVKLNTWFREDEEGQVEGIVWHCKNGNLFKLHRHHLDCKWPILKPRLTLHRVEVNINLDQHECEIETETLLTYFYKLNKRTFHSLEDI